MFNLNPKEDKFYDMFSEAASNVYCAAKLLKSNMETLEDKEGGAMEIEKLEHKGDNLVHDVIEELNKAFITPIDREDIYDIIKELDNILDLIDSTMHRFIMFNIENSTEEANILSNMIVEVTKEVSELMDELKFINKKNSINNRITTINNIEHNGDKFFRETVAQLFKNETDPLNIIKWKDIYQMLEDTIDSCERVANIVEGVVMKNA